MSSEHEHESRAEEPPRVVPAQQGGHATPNGVDLAAIGSLQRSAGNQAVLALLERSGRSEPVLARSKRTWWDALNQALSQPLAPVAPLAETVIDAFKQASASGPDARFGTGYSKMKKEILANWERRIAKGDRIVKVIAGATPGPAAKGYITLESSIRNKTIREIEKIVGFAPNKLGNSALILELDVRNISLADFDARALTHWDPGSAPGYIRGSGAPQWQLHNDMPVVGSTHLTGNQVYKPVAPLSGGAKSAPTRLAAPGVGAARAGAPLAPRLWRGFLRGLNIVDAALLAMQFILQPFVRRLAETNEDILRSLWGSFVRPLIEDEAGRALERWTKNPIAHPASRGERAWVNARWKVVMEVQDEGAADVVVAALQLGNWPEIASRVEPERVWLADSPVVPGQARPSKVRAEGGRRYREYVAETCVLIADPDVSRFLRESEARRRHAQRWYVDLAKGLEGRGLRGGFLGDSWERSLVFALSGRRYGSAAKALEAGMDKLDGADPKVSSYLREFRAQMLQARVEEAEAMGFDLQQRALFKALRELPPDGDQLSITMGLDTKL